ncbi:MAG: phosphopantetheine-binding protein [Candidatus Latescibacteria bacterium]|nr:phosphopantetheine-binding protein [Candidatus Latescibacterota bacterium]
MDAVEERVRGVIASVLGIDGNSFELGAEFTADLGAESVQSIEMMAGFEEEFEIDMDEDEALAVQTVGGAVEFIKKHL